MKNNQFKVINGQIIRSPKRGAVRYTPISNSVLQNSELSFEARGLLCYILSLPEDWVIVKSNIQSNHKETGKNKFDRIWKELSDKKYIFSEKVRDPNSGKFLGWCHIAYEEPNNDISDIGKVQSRIVPKSDNHYITKDTVIKKETRIQKKDLNKDIDTNSGNASVNPAEVIKSFQELFNSGQLTDARTFLNI